MLVRLDLALTLMVAMALKHFCADFLFQTSGIARGKAANTGWLLPLLIHAGGHAALTAAIGLVVAPGMAWLAIPEWGLHAVIDRTKARVGAKLELDTKDTRYWWLFGFDQLLHGLTDIALIGLFLVGAGRG